jgi:predicted GNAT family N-acyltransferase
MADYKIRKLNINDFINYNLHIHSNIEINKYVNFINNILNENHHIIVVEHDDKIIGSGTLLIEHKMTYNGCKMGHIENILIDENMRERKLGSMIVKALTDIAKQHTCYRIDLTCTSDLKYFYKTNGFTIESTSMTMLIPENYS